jgi:hypothetical protein
MALEHLNDMEKQANDVVRQHIGQMEYNDDSRTKVSRAASDYIRMKLREEGFMRKILPAQTITGDDLTKQVVTDKPSKVVELEPDSPGAVSIPFGEFPEGTYIHGRRWLVTFSRIATPMFNKDVAELHDYDMDIRQVISDNSLKDLQAEEDGKFIQAVNNVLDHTGAVTGGSTWANLGLGTSTQKAWNESAGVLSRENLILAKKRMTYSSGRLVPEMALCNTRTAMHFEGWNRDHVGGDASQDLMMNGWAGNYDSWAGLKWVTTIKDDLVPDGSIFFFAAPEYTGRLYFLEDTTMYVKREGPMISFYAYEMLGGGIANTAACSRSDFTTATFGNSATVTCA